MTGVSAAGLGSAMVQCFGKFGMALGTALLGAILDGNGFVATAAEQAASGRAALIASYTYIPGLFMLFTFAVMAFYRLDRDFPGILEELKARREKEARKD